MAAPLDLWRGRVRAFVASRIVLRLFLDLNNPGGPEGDTVTVDEQLLNTEYSCMARW